MYDVPSKILQADNSSNGSTAVGVKPGDEANVRTVAMLLFYMLQEKFLNKSCIYSYDLLPHIILGP
jgi:hypothetical protein